VQQIETCIYAIVFMYAIILNY